MKRFHLLLIVFLFMVLPSVLTAQQKRYRIDDPNAKFGGLLLLQTDNGSGLGGFFEKAINSANRVTTSIQFLIVRGKNDYPIYVPYYDSYYSSDGYSYYTLERSDKTRLSFIPLLFGYKRILLVDKLANEFRPFLQLNAGPLVALDPPNIPDFSERMKNIKVWYNGTVEIGGGMDFAYWPGALISVYFGYEYLRFNQKIDIPEPYNIPEGEDASGYYNGRQDFSGLVLRIGIGKRF
jgi:hypothetical protein